MFGIVAELLMLRLDIGERMDLGKIRRMYYSCGT